MVCGAESDAQDGTDRTRSAVGSRHYLCSAARGICIPCGGARCFQSESDWLGFGGAFTSEPCARSDRDGYRSASSGTWNSDPSLRSRRTRQIQVVVATLHEELR